MEGGKVKPKVLIQNVVASVDLGVLIDLEEAVYKLRGMYEPDQFPGAVYRMEDPKAVFLLSSTGKLICSGAEKEADVYKAVENLLLC